MQSLIVIPARYGSTRLPGKPLKQIAGRTMLARVVDIARRAAADCADTDIVVATDHEDIATHCEDIGACAVMTPEDCASGTDRALAALEAVGGDYEFILNLQGDTPLTPPDFLAALIADFSAHPETDVVTPVVALNWAELDELRAHKAQTPFSGTCATVAEDGRALWFSKNIIPAIRKEADLREKGDLSPVLRHIGIYGYRRAALERYSTLPRGRYEELEGLEQLRLLENGMSIRAVKVDYAGRPAMSGVDSPEDIKRAESLIAEFGDPMGREDAA